MWFGHPALPWHVTKRQPPFPIGCRLAFGVPGTIDSMRWVEDWETIFFGRDVDLSTDSAEGLPR
jgi:hypothetical protein